MATWTSPELETFGNPDEVRIATPRAGGDLRPPRIVWIVRDGDDLYLHSVNGRDAAWFRGSRTAHEGRIQAGRSEHDVTFVEIDDPALGDRLDAAYRVKYRGYPGPVAHVTGPAARAATLRLDPR